MTDDQKQQRVGPPPEFVKLLVDDKVFCVRSSTLLGSNRPAAYLDPGNEEQPGFFHGLLSNLSSTSRSVEETEGSSAVAEQPEQETIPRCRLDLDPDSMETIVDYLRGYDLDIESIPDHTLLCVQRDADMLGITGLYREISAYLESPTRTRCTCLHDDRKRRKGLGWSTVNAGINFILEKHLLSRSPRTGDEQFVSAHHDAPLFHGCEWWETMLKSGSSLSLEEASGVQRTTTSVGPTVLRIRHLHCFLQTGPVFVKPVFARRRLSAVVALCDNPEFRLWYGRHKGELERGTSSDGGQTAAGSSPWTVRFQLSSSDNISPQFRHLVTFEDVLYENISRSKHPSLVAAQRGTTGKSQRSAIGKNRHHDTLVWRTEASKVRFVNERGEEMVDKRSAWLAMQHPMTMCKLFVRPKGVWVASSPATGGETRGPMRERNTPAWGVQWEIPLVQIFVSRHVSLTLPRKVVWETCNKQLQQQQEEQGQVRLVSSKRPRTGGVSQPLEDEQMENVVDTTSIPSAEKETTTTAATPVRKRRHHSASLP